MPIKTTIGITSHWSQWPSSKRSTKNKYCRGRTENGIVLQSWWECKWWNHDGKQHGGSLNTKHRGIIWSCNPIPRLRPRENPLSKWHMHPNFQGSTIYNTRHRIHQNVHWQRNENSAVQLHTGMLLSHNTERNNNTGSSFDISRNYHLTNAFQREKDKYPKISCSSGIYKFTPMN